MMVTWTFDLIALTIGFLIGMLAGALLYCTVEMLSGGSYAKGLYDGSDLKHLLSLLKQYKEDKNKID